MDSRYLWNYRSTPAYTNVYENRSFPLPADGWALPPDEMAKAKAAIAPTSSKEAAAGAARDAAGRATESMSSLARGVGQKLGLASAAGPATGQPSQAAGGPRY